MLQRGCGISLPKINKSNLDIDLGPGHPALGQGLDQVDPVFSSNLGNSVIMWILWLWNHRFNLHLKDFTDSVVQESVHITKMLLLPSSDFQGSMGGGIEDCPQVLIWIINVSCVFYRITFCFHISSYYSLVVILWKSSTFLSLPKFELYVDINKM